MSNCIDSSQRTGAETCRTSASRNSIRRSRYASIDVCYHRHCRLFEIQPLEIYCQSVLRRLHQRAMKRRTHFQLDHPLRNALQQLYRTVNCFRVSRDHDLVRRIYDSRPRKPDLRLLLRRRYIAQLPPITAAIAPVPTGTASCMYWPRARTVRTASDKLKAPAATSAEYSPRLCPATNDGRRFRFPRGAKRRYRNVRIAGCVFSVNCKSSAGPQNRAAKLET